MIGSDYLTPPRPRRRRLPITRRRVMPRPPRPRRLPRPIHRRRLPHRSRPVVIVRPRPTVIVTPGPAPLPPASALAWLDPRASAVLRRRGLLTGLWLRRWASAGQPLRAFVNRFYPVPGVEHVLRASFGDNDQRAQARLMLRLAGTLAQRSPDVVRRMIFRRALAFAPDSYVAFGLELVVDGVHYAPKAWVQIDHPLLARQLRRDVLRFGQPGRMRWVFARGRLGRNRAAVVATIRRILAGQRLPAATRSWIAALDRMIVVV